MSFLETSSGVEIDLLVEKTGKPPILVEIKSATRLTKDHWRGLEQVRSDFEKSRRMIAYRGAESRRVGSGIDVLPWARAIEEILA